MAAGGPYLLALSTERRGWMRLLMRSLRVGRLGW
jgi:hypothetical protein